MNRLLLILIFSFLPLLANQTNNQSTNKTNISPSFDCKKATLEVEKLICQNEELSKLDNEMAKAYKHMLSISNETEKQKLIEEQKRWLKYRDNKVIGDDRNNKISTYELYIKYSARIFYLQEEGYHLVYVKDDLICNDFLNILKNNTNDERKIDLSKIKEFNWLNWKVIQDESEEGHLFKILISYFDINNDEVDEAIFKEESQPASHGGVITDIKYTHKENGQLIERHSENNTIYATRENILLKQLNIDVISYGDSIYYNPNYEIKIESESRGLYSSIHNFEPYPLKIRENYHIAIFGMSSWGNSYDSITHASMVDFGNRINLIKFNPENQIDTICVVSRIDKNQESFKNILIH